jgi:hypothetical protein
MIKLVVAMFVSVVNAQSGALVGSHSLQGFETLDDCRSQEELVAKQIEPLYAHWQGGVKVGTVCVSLSSNSAKKPRGK